MLHLANIFLLVLSLSIFPAKGMQKRNATQQKKVVGQTVSGTGKQQKGKATFYSKRSTGQGRQAVHACIMTAWCALTRLILLGHA